MSPYLTKEAHETDIVEPLNRKKAQQPKLPAFTPMAGDFLLYIGQASKSRRWYLVKVTDYLVDEEYVNFHYLNTKSGSKLPLVGHRFVWIAAGKAEKHSMLPVEGFTAAIQGNSADQLS